MNLRQRARVLRGLEPDPLPEDPDPQEHPEATPAKIHAAKGVRFVAEGDDEEEVDDE